MSGSLYIHVPFCRSKCAYCDFYSVAMEPGLAARYVKAIRSEIQGRVGGQLDTVFIGGGTPSVLPEGSIRDMLDCLGEHAHIADGAEVSLEANPESLSPGFIEEAMGAGVNRLSVGVQSFEDELLRLLMRPHSSSEALKALDRLKARRLDFSMDLMYSIPGQAPGAWERTLETAIGLGPSHISAYELTLEPGTLLERLAGEGKLRRVGESESLAMYHIAAEKLAGAGYEHYEVSNYALASKRSRHNMNYWRRGEYLGLGPSAVSFRAGVRTRNLPDVNEYCDAIERGASPASEEEFLTPEEASREFLMLGLRTTDGVDMAEASARYGLGSLAGASASFVESGMMAKRDGKIFLTGKGMPLMNSILVELFGLLDV